MKKQFIIIPLLLVILCSSFIIRRHDILDEKYLEYGKNGGFESLALFEFDDGTPIGNGTLIAPQWVITAEHVAVGIAKGSTVIINEKKYTVEKVVIYAQKETRDLHEKKDIALVKLSTEVTNTNPVSITKTDPKKGTLIHLAGNGAIGDGITGQSKNKYTDKKIRGATNTIEETGLYIEFVFDNPNSGKATKLEGVSGFRDSGGPIYIKKGKELILAGVSSFQEGYDTGRSNGRYGVREYYVNVYRFTEWINTILQDKGYYETTINNQTMVVIIENEKISSLSIDNRKGTKDEMQNYAEQILKEYTDLSSKSIADQITIFLKFITQVALDAKIIDSPKTVGFKLSNEEVYLNGNKLSDEDHKRVLKKYTDLFETKIKPEETIDYEP